MRYNEWTLIDWDGNSSLNLKCWRKSFRKGYVSIGVGEFLDVVYSYGANSDFSMSSTRWNYDEEPISEDAMKDYVDLCHGFPTGDAISMGYIKKKVHDDLYTGKNVENENPEKSI